ncbi:MULTISPECIES: hypothetical protein [Novosphingobium]|uniref:Uncharacterized protein n=1 Tax=Novosphingobium sediminicola TaxID=563162 RepID=A0A7W6G7L7_9SPHN|nr:MULTISPECIES: hypothetical protein [Novosphingobium]MBB3956290.1 hypothetical protein [Novosphingobium sediminicola]MDR6710364.1 hypothetical protein [Novosphingobium sp. 1748]
MIETAPTTAGRAFFVALMEWGGFRLAIACAVLGAVGIFVVADKAVPAQAAVGILVILLAMIWILYEALRSTMARCNALQSEVETVRGEIVSPVPKVLKALANGELTIVSLLLEPHPLFGQSMAVSIYFDDPSGFEYLIGHGGVLNVQANGKINIRVTDWIDGYEHIRTSIMANEAENLRRVLIRPGGAAQTPQSVCTMPFTPEIFDLLLTRGGHGPSF